LFGEKTGFAVVAALNHVLRHAGQGEAGFAGHGGRFSQGYDSEKILASWNISGNCSLIRFFPDPVFSGRSGGSGLFRMMIEQWAFGAIRAAH
jgi:hypothetical protein